MAPFIWTWWMKLCNKLLGHFKEAKANKKTYWSRYQMARIVFLITCSLRVETKRRTWMNWWCMVLKEYIGIYSFLDSSPAFLDHPKIDQDSRLLYSFAVLQRETQQFSQLMLPIQNNWGPLKGPWVIALSLPYTVYTRILWKWFIHVYTSFPPQKKYDVWNPSEPRFTVKMIQKWLTQQTPGPTAADWYSDQRSELTWVNCVKLRSYCWCFRNPKQPPDMYKTPATMG